MSDDEETSATERGEDSVLKAFIEAMEGLGFKARRDAKNRHPTIILGMNCRLEVEDAVYKRLMLDGR